MKNSPLNILLINPSDHSIVADALADIGSPLPVRRSATVADAVSQLDNHRLDIVVFEIVSMDEQAIQTITTLQAAPTSVPIIVVSNTEESDTQRRALRNGAQDFIHSSDVSCAKLERSILFAIERHNVNADLHDQLSEQDKRQRTLDDEKQSLTALYQTVHRFVDNVSHEFRTPLTVIKEYTSLLQEELVGELNGEQHEFLDVIGDRADDLNNIVNDMLDVSKLESGNLGLRRKNANVSEIVDRVRSGLERKALVRGICLEIDSFDELPQVYCDPEKVGRVITNLAINAIKFCQDPGHVHVWGELQSAKQEVRICISDNGPGIDESARVEIFNRFKQLGNSSANTAGYGLGLNIARELVDLNFGEMDLESELGVGSTFVFTIPLADPLVILERFIQRTKAESDQITVVQVLARPDREPSSCDGIDSFLHYVLACNDLVFRTANNRWLIVLPVAESKLPEFVDRVAANLAKTNRNRPQGPLPKIRWNLLGTWQSDEQSEVIAAVAKELQPKHTRSIRNHSKHTAQSTHLSQGQHEWRGNHDTRTSHSLS